MKTPLSLLVVLTALFLSLSAHGRVLFVNASMPAGGDGASWLTACRYLQDALAQTVAGDEVWVAAGTYYPDDGIAITSGDRTASFTLKQDVKLYGGFVSGETAIGQRNPEANLTLLSGEIWTDQLYWSLHVVTLVGNATLDGVTVAKGNANGEASPFNRGGGVFVSGSFSLTINQCRFTTNTAFSGGAISSSSSSSPVTAINCTFSGNTADYGGAITSSPVMAINCTFSGNTASSGGAISSSSVTATNCMFSGNIASSGGAIIFGSSVTAINCTFSGNTASSGGAIYSAYSAYSSPSVTATNCMFSDNTASSGGAVSSSSVTATNCTFSGNTASSPSSTSSGGAIYSASVTATNCTFSDNTVSSSAIYASYGGAIFSSSSVTATNCTFSSNTASTSSSYYSSISYGGAISSSFSSLVTATNCTFSGNMASSPSSSYGGAISSSSSSSVTATNCTFSGNTASSGGAISSSSVTATNSTLLNNLAKGAGNKGGAIYATGLVKFFNNVLWHKLAEVQNNLIYVTSTGSIRNADSQFPSPLNQAKNLIKGGVAAITTETGAVVSLGDTAVTVLSSDPLFLNAADPVGPDGIWKTPDDGLRLQANSPALDLGLSMFLPVDTYDLDKDGNLTELIPVDFAGYDRIQRAALDLGSYEAGETVLPIAVLAQPASFTQLRELSATFTVTATGHDLRYQWYRGTSGNVSQPIAGATGNSYASPELISNSSYWVRVSNGLGFIDSQTATATVVPIIINSQPSNTIVTVGTTATLSVTASGKGLSYQWFQGARGDVGNPMSGATLPSFTTPALVAATVFWVRITNPYGVLDSDAATVSVTADLLGAAMNVGSSLIYTTGGTASWFGQSITTRDGYSAAQSGVITHSQITDVQTTVGTAGTISFWWSVSSQSGGDFLRFYIDGVEQSGSISGTTGTWALKTFPVVSAGSHTFKWAYTKNSSTSSGSDCGWVDEVVWSPKLITTQPISVNILSGTSAPLGVVASGANLSYQWYAGDSGVTTNPISSATSSNVTSPALTSTSKYWVKVGNGVGYESSATATITVFQPNQSIANALNTGAGVSYFTWGNLPWSAQSTTTRDGVSAMQSGTISHSQSSVTEATVTGPGTFSFWRKVSSELGFDFLRFYIDGVEQGSFSGELDWQQATYNLSGAGAHNLKWVYAKDDSKTSGSDRAWLDQVAWQPAPITTNFQTWASGHNLTGNDALMTANPSGDAVTNLLKYALGLNPNVPTLAQTDGTIPGLPSMARSGASMKFTFIKDTAKSDLTYTVEGSGNLGSWQPVTSGVLETPLAGTLVRVEVTIPVSDQKFCRLKVTK